MKMRVTVTKLLSALTFAAMLALCAAASAQNPVVTKTPHVMLNLKFVDLWCPTGTACKFYMIPNYNPANGILTVAVGNAGRASSSSCSLRVKEYRGEEGGGGVFAFHADYWAPVPLLTPGQQVAIAVHVAKWTGGFDSGKKPIKHPRQWIITADAKKQVLELNENNNGTTWYTYN